MHVRHTLSLAALFVATWALAEAGRPYQSTFSDYRPYVDGTPGDWRAVNANLNAAQAGGAAHDHGTRPGAAAPAAHDHGGASGDAGAPSRGQGAAGRGMDHDAMQRMHKGMDRAAMEKKHESHMHGRDKGGHAGHGTPEKKP